MYMVKVSSDRSILSVHLYNEYEHALADMINWASIVYEGVPGIYIGDYSRPKIVCASDDGVGGCDLEFKYDNGIVVTIATPIIEDER